MNIAQPSKLHVLGSKEEVYQKYIKYDGIFKNLLTVTKTQECSKMPLEGKKREADKQKPCARESKG